MLSVAARRHPRSGQLAPRTARQTGPRRSNGRWPARTGPSLVSRRSPHPAPSSLFETSTPIVASFTQHGGGVAGFATTAAKDSTAAKLPAAGDKAKKDSPKPADKAS